MSGDNEAMHRMGNNYYFGYNNLKVNHVEAFKWYEMAALKGDAKGLGTIGMMYYKGDGVEKSNEKAFTSFQMGANKGASFSMYNLAKMYYNGEGVEKNEKKAFNWFLKAANKDDATAQNWVGYFYDQGKAGLDIDYEKAAFWYEKSANQNDDHGQRLLGLLYYKGDGVKQDLLRAGELIFLSSENGNSEAKAMIENHSSKCLEIEPASQANLPYNLQSCFLSAFSGSPQSSHAVGLAYYKGQLGLDKNYEQAALWLTKSAHAGYSRAQYDLGMLYANGNGLKKNIVESYAWLSTSLDSKGLHTSQMTRAKTKIEKLFSLMNETSKEEAKAKTKQYIEKFVQ